MDHDRAVLFAVRAGVLQLKALGKLHVELDRAALPGTAEAVGQMEIELRAVERAVALVDDVALAHLGHGGLERFGGEIPVLHIAHVILGHRGDLDLVAQAEHGVDLVEQADDILDLVLHLLPGHEDVRVVLREAADTEEAVQRAGKLVAVDKAQLAHAQRQIAVGVRLGLVYEHAARAVHRLDGVVLAVDDGGVHVLLIVLPVAGALPQRAVEDHRRGDLHIAVALVHLTPVVNERVAQHHALRQEEREAGAFVHEREEAELLAELAVVALLGFLDAGEVLVEHVLAREAHGIEALEHFALGIAAPVGARDVRDLDAVALDTAGGIKMRTGAQVGELALAVEGNEGVLRQIVDQLDLVRLLGLFHKRNGLGAGQLKALELQLFLADLAHFLLDGFKVVGREGVLAVDVVIEALFDRGADGKLRARVQAADRLRHDVRAGMMVRFTVFGIFPAVSVLFHDVSSDVYYSFANKKKHARAKNGTGVL